MSKNLFEKLMVYCAYSLEVVIHTVLSIYADVASLTNNISFGLLIIPDGHLAVIVQHKSRFCTVEGHKNSP